MPRFLKCTKGFGLLAPLVGTSLLMVSLYTMAQIHQSNLRLQAQASLKSAAQFAAIELIETLRSQTGLNLLNYFSNWPQNAPEAKYCTLIQDPNLANTTGDFKRGYVIQVLDTSTPSGQILTGWCNQKIGDRGVQSDTRRLLATVNVSFNGWSYSYSTLIPKW